MNGIILWSPGITLEAIERQVIQRAYEHYRGNKTATAGALGISIRTLDERLKRYEDDFKAEEAMRERDRQSRDAELARSRGITVGSNFEIRPTAAAVKEGSVHQASQGVRLEPVANTSGKQTVPVSERSEIQDVLPPKVAQGGSRRNR